MRSAKIFYDYRDLHLHLPVLTNGCFDILHAGHLFFLEMAKFNFADRPLVVAVNDDESVRLLKGPERPINTAEDRMALLAGLMCVDYVLLFSGKNVAHIIRQLRPQTWVKGAPYTRETLDMEEVAAADSVNAKIIIMDKFGDYSTTGTLEKLAKVEKALFDR